MIKTYYYRTRKNVGDYYGFWLLKKMLPDERIKYSKKSPDIICCGSIVDLKLPSSTLCWGCGIHNKNNRPVYSKNKDVYCAVRGKLTADRIGLKNAVTGDTGTLAPLFYTPSICIKKNKFAIIAHYSEARRLKRKFGKLCKVISAGTNTLEEFWEFINQCEFIFSTSLHGIIFSHAFGVPAIHVEGRELESRDNFKFKDYYSNLDIPYIKEKLSTNLNFVDKYLKEPMKYLPSKKCIKNIQSRLLEAFPYKKQLVRNYNIK